MESYNNSTCDNNCVNNNNKTYYTNTFLVYFGRVLPSRVIWNFSSFTFDQNF